MALNAYLLQTQLLLNDTSGEFYTTTNLTSYINEGRNQLANATEMLITTDSLTVASGTLAFKLSSVGDGVGYASLINIRAILVPVGGMLTLLDGRPWEWFRTYYRNGANSLLTGPPTVWSQESQGETGAAFLWPTTDTNYDVQIEGTWVPEVLVDDTTPEVIPYPWTDAIQFYAAYKALLNAQRPSDAAQMFQNYQRYIKAARLGVTPESLPNNFPTGKALPDPFDPNLSTHPGSQPANMTEGNI